MGASRSSLILITRDDAQWVISHPWHFNFIFTEQVIILAKAVFDIKFKGKLLWSTVWFFADTKNIYLMKQNKILWQLIQFVIESEFTSSSFPMLVFNMKYMLYNKQHQIETGQILNFIP